LAVVTLAMYTGAEQMSCQRPGDIDAQVNACLCQRGLSAIISSIVGGTDIGVTIADPQLSGQPLIAMSQGFQVLSGYQTHELTGRNLRICDQSADAETMFDLRNSCKTGASFTGMFEGRRKSGENCLTLLNMLGLSIAEDIVTGEEVWFLIGLHADVSNLEEEEGGIPVDELSAFNQSATEIRNRLIDTFAWMAIEGAMAFRANQKGVATGAWRLLPRPKWRNGMTTQSTPYPASPSLDADVETLSSFHVSLTSSSQNSSRKASPSR